MGQKVVMGFVSYVAPISGSAITSPGYRVQHNISGTGVGWEMISSPAQIIVFYLSSLSQAVFHRSRLFTNSSFIAKRVPNQANQSIAYTRGGIHHKARKKEIIIKENLPIKSLIIDS